MTDIKCDIEFEGLVEQENCNNAFDEMFVVEQVKVSSSKCLEQGKSRVE